MARRDDVGGAALLSRSFVKIEDLKGNKNYKFIKQITTNTRNIQFTCICIYKYIYRLDFENMKKEETSTRKQRLERLISKVQIDGYIIRN